MSNACREMLDQPLPVAAALAGIDDAIRLTRKVGLTNTREKSSHCRPLAQKFSSMRDDDRGEHHLEHRHVAQVELRHQLARAAEAGAFEDEAEGEAEAAR